MAELRAGAALAHEPLERPRTGDVREDHLDRDLVAEQNAARPVHGAHAAFRQRRENLVAPVEDLPDASTAQFSLRAS